jgi:cell division protein FtsB
MENLQPESPTPDLLNPVEPDLATASDAEPDVKSKLIAFAKTWWENISGRLKTVWPSGLKTEFFTDGRFYRKLRIKSRFRLFVENVKTNPKAYLKTALICISILFLLAGDYGVIQRIRLELRKREALKQLEAEQKKTDDLRSQIKRANDLDEIERVAREKYNLAKKDETVYQMK